ncbi:hypothetical protein GP486_004252 [Trichoglossum hirsutum]|uniref:WD repeat protein n=1 Tax=Trichoglossum hirsutum TaxID=265104 RepID=A0A9P8LBK4_9PEZI|nr:hypothetical protein GP486_004252 [Trichoglossum hirsutum]
MAESVMQIPTVSAIDSVTFNVDMSIRVDQPVRSMSISPCGRDVVLASRQGLHIVDLDSPYEQPRHLPYLTAWEVADVQWSPFPARDFWVVSTSNQKALVWNLAASSHGPIEHVLHAHTRAITDINFSVHEPDLLATCAVDSFVHCWDLRRPARPAISFCDWFAGATQVKWNRQDSNIIASSHDRYLRIWDKRKGAYPLRSIDAHETKIYGLDWNRARPTAVVTCSLDKTIKLWDYSNQDDIPERVIRTPFPVWRARHTPFGTGLLAMPQRGNNDLHLYNRPLGPGVPIDGFVEPVHKFQGHQDQVKEVLWRPRGNIDDGIDNREFQLVSWGMDRDLRLHRVSEKILAEIGYVRGREVRKGLLVTRRNAIYRTFREEITKPTQNHQAKPQSEPRVASEHGIGGTLRDALGAGKAKAPIPPTRGWLEGRAGTGMQARRTVRKEINPISWMKGVKIGKRLPEVAGGLGRHGSFHGRHPLISPHASGSGSWDAPESLGDEITHVGAKFSKVVFEEVSVANRAVVVSMNGPWGAGRKSVYIKLEIKFPVEYPETSAPEFKLEKTSSISDASLKEVCSDLYAIADGYASRKRGCLEAILRYLLGERGLEDSTAWLKDEHDRIAGAEIVADDTSSDEEALAADPSGSHSQDLDMLGTGLFGAINKHANVPLPRECGATFSVTGKLVCYFPPKEDKTKSLLSTLVLKDTDRSSRGKIFEGFGRLHAGSPGPKRKTASTDEREEDGYDSSDDSFASSSGSSGFSDDDPGLPTRYNVSLAWRNHPTIGRRFRRTHSTDRSQRSGGTGTATNKAVVMKPKNIVSIHSFEYLLPAKRGLAEEYAIYGNGPEVCSHNARVAASHGAQELVDVWEFARLILHNEVPLEIMPQPHRREPILVVARRAAETIKRRDSGLHLEFEDQEMDNTSLMGRVKWGRHPLGGRWFIDALFQHFERLADIQMLAMLASVFSEPAAKEGVSNAMMRLPQHAIPMPMKSPAFSLDYFPSADVAWSLYQPTFSVPPSPRPSATPIGTHGSVGSSNGLWGSDPVTPYSTGNTPPLMSKLSRANSDLNEHHSHSLSNSPEQQMSRRANSAVNFAANLSRPYANALSSSPPMEKKRVSPVESMLGNITSGGVTWGANTIFGPGVRGKAASSNATYSSDEAEEGEAGETRIRITMKNQNMFDDEGYVSVPLLDPKKSLRYSGYRESYAELLYIWNLQLQRLEILKFNGLKSYFNDETEGEGLISLGRRNADATESRIWPGLDLGGHCIICESPLEGTHVGGASGECESCETEQTMMQCSVCKEVIQGLYAPCLNCGHAAHSNCHRRWFIRSEVGCPMGCECLCRFDAVVEQADLRPWSSINGVVREKEQGLVEGEDMGLEDWVGLEDGLSHALFTNR